MLTIKLDTSNTTCDAKTGTLVVRYQGDKMRPSVFLMNSSCTYKVVLPDGAEYIHVLLWAKDNPDSLCVAMQGHAYVDIMDRTNRQLVLQEVDSASNEDPQVLEIAKMDLVFLNPSRVRKSVSSAESTHVHNSLWQYCSDVYEALTQKYPASKQSEHRLAGDWLYNDTYMHSFPFCQRITLAYFELYISEIKPTD